MTNLAGAPEAIASADTSMWNRGIVQAGGSNKEGERRVAVRGGRQDHTGEDSPVARVCLREHSKASLMTLAGRLTVGAEGNRLGRLRVTNWTTFGTDSSEICGLSGSPEMPWETFCRLGGGNDTDFFFRTKSRECARFADAQVLILTPGSSPPIHPL
jgi:hypothetical protein